MIAKHIEQITSLRKLNSENPDGMVTMDGHIEEVARGHKYAIEWARADARGLILDYISRLENDAHTHSSDNEYEEYDNEFVFQKYGTAGIEGHLIALQGIRDELLKGLF